jgi:hypothetical protein
VPPFSFFFFSKTTTWVSIDWYSPRARVLQDFPLTTNFYRRLAPLLASFDFFDPIRWSG